MVKHKKVSIMLQHLIELDNKQKILIKILEN
jgi:hypothetical protein